MAPYPGAAGSFTQVNSNQSPVELSKGQYHYLLAKGAAGETQLYNTQPTFETTVNATEASQAVVLTSQEGNPAPSVSVEISYASAPGAGETIAIQEADTDADAFYITPSNPAYTVSSFNSNNVARVDLSPTGGKFMRVLRTPGANNVGCRVKVTRMA